MVKEIKKWDELSDEQKSAIRKEFTSWNDSELKKLGWYKTKDGKWTGRARSDYLAHIFGI